MKFTDRELELAHRLHELLLVKGEPMEIREGDWILTPDGGKNEPYLVKWTFTPGSAREFYILLPSWERCREWLREKGWILDLHHDREDIGRVNIAFERQESFRILRDGATDREAILVVMCAVAEAR